MASAELTRGDYFGEGILLGQYRCGASVIAKEYSECVVLLAADFERITENYPGVEHAIRVEREARIKQNARTKSLMDKLTRQAQQGCVRERDSVRGTNLLSRSMRRFAMAGIKQKVPQPRISTTHHRCFTIISSIQSNPVH